ncbi:MAG: dihydrofolate reductase family protein [Bacteroidales bacterium]
MQKLRVESFSISIDGFGAGPDQSLKNPLGVGGAKLHQWFYPTKTFNRKVMGKDGGTSGADNDFAARGFHNVGAWILGRNMFGPVRGPWPDEKWRGWWGETPPYHMPVFVLTNYFRKSFTMNGGTTFYFVTEGIHAALDQAFKAAAGKDVRIGGGVNTIRQYLAAKLIDEMHLVVSPILLGSGEPIFADMDLVTLGYECVEHTATENATHCMIKKIL